MNFVCFSYSMSGFISSEWKIHNTVQEAGSQLGHRQLVTTLRRTDSQWSPEFSNHFRKLWSSDIGRQDQNRNRVSIEEKVSKILITEVKGFFNVCCSSARSLVFSMEPSYPQSK